jgi:hypothetical protein
MSEQLMDRVHRLETVNRRWKRLALVCVRPDTMSLAVLAATDTD